MSKKLEPWNPRTLEPLSNLNMTILIDIGNTNITVGVYDRDIKGVLRIRTIIDGRNEEEYSYLLGGFLRYHAMENPEGAVISSVVPKITPLMTNALRKSFGIRPIIVDHKINTGISFMVKKPENLGSDRIASAVGAHRLYKGDLIVIDFGTATTFCVVTAKGEYWGGAIMPGPGISADSLAEKTAKLPRVDLKALGSIIGEDTRENILAGVIMGHAGGVERIIKEIRKETGVKFKVVSTGGMAVLVVPYIRSIKIVDPLLTLKGLKFIYELNAR
jgi:type III pantothenate kinase